MNERNLAGDRVADSLARLVDSEALLSSRIFALMISFLVLLRLVSYCQRRLLVVPIADDVWVRLLLQVLVSVKVVVV